MSIQPIDLQNLLLRLDIIGKQQTAQQELVAHNQQVTGSELAQHSEEAERQVGETHITDEGPDQVNEHGSQADGERREQPRQEQEATEPEVLSDPDLGRNIDVSG